MLPTYAIANAKVNFLPDNSMKWRPLWYHFLSFEKLYKNATNIIFPNSMQGELRIMHPDALSMMEESSLREYDAAD